MTHPKLLAGSMLLLAAALLAQQAKKPEYRTSPTGYEDTPVLPGQTWRVHDIKRPRPPQVTPSEKPGGPPSDAIVLFDGKDLSKWTCAGKGCNPEKPGWKVENGYMEVVKGTGELLTKEKFGDMQLHIEWASPTVIDGDSQWRGNSGVIIMGRYEIQVLDSWNNPTYADGQAGAIYGQWPPRVNISRKPGEWQTYDIMWEAPKFEKGALVKPAYVTVIHNGALLHHHQEILGAMAHKVVGKYSPHAPEEALLLQNHDTTPRYRNIWVRRIKPYDQY